jgi:hypothetical protein
MTWVVAHRDRDDTSAPGVLTTSEATSTWAAIAEVSSAMPTGHTVLFIRAT